MASIPRPRGHPAAARRKTLLSNILDDLRAQVNHLKTFAKIAWCVTWSTLQWLLWRSELLAAIANNHKLQSEPRKKAIDRNRWRVSAKCSKHLLPLGITSALLSLNFAQIFWEAAGKRDQNTNLNALLFAAKVHELLVVSSLSLIVLDHVQFQLLRGRGVPLGAIFSGFQISDVAALWKPDFWGTALAKQNSKHGIFLGFLVILSVTIGALTGPSSAILMLPSLDWWSNSLSSAEMRKSFASNTGFYINSPHSKLMPTEISSLNFLPDDCNFTTTRIPLHCPAGGITDLLAWDGSQLSIGGPYNVTVAAGELSRFLQGTVASGGNYLSYVFQTTSAMVSNLLPNIQNVLRSLPPPEGLPPGTVGAAMASDLGWPYEPTRFAVSSADDHGLPAPQTFAFCSPLVYDSFNDTFETDGSFDTNLQFPLRPTINSTGKATAWNFTAPVSLVEMWKAQNTFASVWVAPPELNDETPSIGVAFMGNKSYEVFGEGILPEIYVVTCSLYAGWWPVATYMDTTDAYIHSPSTNNPGQTLNDWTSERANASRMQLVKLDLTWAHRALPTNETIGRIYKNLVATRGPAPSAAFGPTVSMLLTDALARYGMDNTMTFGDLVVFSDGTRVRSNGGNLTAANSTPFEFTRLRYGYSYSMHGTTRQLASGLLLVHSLMALIHIATVLWRGYVYEGFKSLPEIFALGVNSSTSQALANTCAGIARFNTYKHIVKIREVSTAHLGLVIDDEGIFPAPVEGKMYGERSLDEKIYIARWSARGLSWV